MKKIFFAASLAILFGLTSSSKIVLAQENSAGNIPDANQEARGTTTLVATVNIYRAKIDSQNGNKFKISFDLNNQEKIQPDIKYGIHLQQTVGKDQKIYDEYVYPKAITLGIGQTMKVELDYTAPSHLKGDYDLWLVAGTSRGFLLALSSVGKVTLDGDGQYIEIVKDKCFLQVQNEKDSPKYNLMQGVDIVKNEKIEATCEIANHFKKTVIADAYFKTYYRSPFGNLISESKIQDQPVILVAGEIKTIKLVLPEEQKPQAYHTMLTFEENGKQIRLSWGVVQKRWIFLLLCPR